MGETTKIAWSNATWNPVIGCSHVSPGCEHCYAETLALRYGWSKHPWGAQHAAENVVLKPHKLGDPLKWKAPRMIFVNSLSDVFHEQIPNEYIARMFAVMNACPSHVFQILTKRPARMAQLMASKAFENLVDEKCAELAAERGWVCLCELDSWPLPNVWLGVSVEDQRRADERIPLLLQTPAAIRFLSCEPLLGWLHLEPWLVPTRVRAEHHDHLTDGYWHDGCAFCQRRRREGGTGIDAPIDWVIVGGESGSGYRPMDLDWARSLRDQCQASGTAYFFKQGSGPRPGMNATLDAVEYHEFPTVAAG